MKYLLSLFLITFSLFANAGYEWEYKPNSTVTYTLTLEPCLDLANPDTLDLKYAYAFDTTTGVIMKGCSMIDGDIVELQFINEAQKKHFQMRLPKRLFKLKESI